MESKFNLLRHYYLSQQVYSFFARLRTQLFRPLILPLVYFRLRPNWLSIFGLALVVPFFVLLPSQPVWAFVFLAVSLFVDLLDGPLARARGMSSDQGKKLDIFCDLGRFIFFILALAASNFISIELAIGLALTCVFSYYGRTIMRLATLKPQEKFKDTGGFLFLPGLIVFALFLIFFFSLFFQDNYYQYFWLALGLFIIDDLIQLFKLISHALAQILADR